MLCFKDLNKPVTLNDIERMEGRQQSEVLAANQDLQEDVRNMSAVHGAVPREDKKFARKA